MSDEALVRYSIRIGWAVGILTFFGAYIYCIATYGFLFGVGLGWLPAAIVAVVAGGLAMFLWAPALILIAVLIVYMMNH